MPMRVSCGRLARHEIRQVPGTPHNASYFLLRRYSHDSVARPAPISSLERKLNGLHAKVFTSKRVKTGTGRIGSFFHRFHGIRHILGTFPAPLSRPFISTVSTSSVRMPCGKFANPNCPPGMTRSSNSPYVPSLLFAGEPITSSHFASWTCLYSAAERADFADESRAWTTFSFSALRAWRSNVL
jgi:hypothetical protein